MTGMEPTRASPLHQSPSSSTHRARGKSMPASSSSFHAPFHALILLLLPLSSASRALASPTAQGSDEWLPMPGGLLFHRSCIHHHSGHFSSTLLPNGTEIISKAGHPDEVHHPCPFPPRRRPSLASSASLGYYSDWVAYASAADTVRGYSSLSSIWKVPPAPKSRGPAGLSSIYIFNGLEDGNGHWGSASLILQPVLSYGKSGCVLNPLYWGRWNFLSFLVSGSGRAHCGKRIGVREGDELVGTMSKVGGGNNTWLTTSTLSRTNESSTYQSDLGEDKKIDAAYLTMEGMILYSCAAYPGGNGTTFTDNILVDGRKNVVERIKWEPIVKHSECKQGVQFAGNGDVSLLYDATTTN